MSNEESRAPIKNRSQDSKTKTVRDIGEFGLISRIAKRSGKADASVLTGIGDDAAVISTREYGAMLVTTDSLVEDIHFRRYHPPEALGWKALCVNISDIAAMGGIPRYYLLSLSLPSDLSLDYLDQFCLGMDGAAERYGLSLIGGDTTSSDKIYISLTVLGGASGRVLLRNGARPGDAIFVTGTLGDSALGLKIMEELGIGNLEAGAKSDDPQVATRNQLISRHLRPTPRVDEGMLLAKSGMVTSMIDISDGLLADLGHICEESKVGAMVSVEKIPLSKGFEDVSERYGGIDLALSGGEDYELLFTVRGEHVATFFDGIKGMKCTRVGEIVEGNEIELGENGVRRIPEKRGFEHFKG